MLSENILSGSAFEFGSDQTAFKTYVKIGYLAILVEVNYLDTNIAKFFLTYFKI